MSLPSPGVRHSDVLMLVGGGGRRGRLAAVGRDPDGGEGGQPVAVAMPIGVRPRPGLRLLLLLDHDRPRRGSRRRSRVPFLFLLQLEAHSLDDAIEVQVVILETERKFRVKFTHLI